MSNVITVTAPEHKHFPGNSVKVFLAGGICKCIEWQKTVIEGVTEEGDKFSNRKDIYLINPRRDNFVMAEGETVRQIEWEFDMLEACDIFTMYFAGGESDQPICQYELGRNIERMKQKYPTSWQSRIVITCDSSYKRLEDVLNQVRLATDGKVGVMVQEGDAASVDVHTKCIINAINNVNLIAFNEMFKKLS